MNICTYMSNHNDFSVAQEMLSQGAEYDYFQVIKKVKIPSNPQKFILQVLYYQFNWKSKFKPIAISSFIIGKDNFLG